MNTFLFTCLYIHVHIYRHPWDVWSSLALNILSRPEWWTSSLYFFFIFLFSFKTTPPHRNGPLLWLCNYRFGVLPYRPNWLTWKCEQNMKWWRLPWDWSKVSIQMKMCIVKTGIIWFDVSLWHKYETTCQGAELEQIIFLKWRLK